MTDSKLYFRGPPLEPEVTKLRNELGRLVAGNTIRHEDIERILRRPRTENRYKSVVCAWRKALMNEENIIFTAVIGVGLLVLDDVGKMNDAYKLCRRGARQMAKAETYSVKVRREQLADESDARRYDHLRHHLSSTVGVVEKEMRLLHEAFKAPEQLPKPKLVNS